MQFFGLGVLPLIAIPMAWAVTLIGHHGVSRPLRSILAWAGAAFCASTALAVLPVPGSWALAAGLGGNAGDGLGRRLAYFSEAHESALCPQATDAYREPSSKRRGRRATYRMLRTGATPAARLRRVIV
jgi:NAD(P)H-hydrate repair Nnr-like enzyme with NAD(P)H-hydrate epimerase domain